MITKDNVLTVSDDELLSQKIDDKAKPVKLSHWKNEPKLADLKYDYDEARRSQAKHLSDIETWQRLYDAPKFGGDKHKGSRVTPKLVRKQAEWNAPSLSEPFLSATNLFDVKPLTFDDVGRAKQNALILNRQFNNELNKTKLIDGIIRSLVKNGTCVVRTGWDFQEKEVEEEVEQFEYTSLSPQGTTPEMMGGQEQPMPPELAGLMPEQMPEPSQEQLPPELMQAMGEPSQEMPPELAGLMGGMGAMPNPMGQEAKALEEEYARLSELKQVNPDSYEQEPSELKAGFEMSEEKGELLKAKSIGFKKQKVLKTISNKPTVELCNLKNIYIDPTCLGDMDKASFVIHSYEASLAQLKRTNHYTNLDKLEESLTSTDGFDLDSHTDFKFKDTARRKLTIYEYWGYWDIEDNNELVPIVVAWCGETIIRMSENPFPDGKLPFVVFNYLPEENSVYGIPNAELLGDNQEILGAVTRGMIDLLGKSANSQTGYAKNFLDPTNKAKFMKGLDYEYNQGFMPQQHVYTHKYPEIPNSTMNIVQMMNNEAESLSGVKAFSGTGISASNLGDVAAGVRGVLDAVSKREMSILRRISDGVIKLGRKIIAMNAEFLSEQEVVRITNNEFITIRRDDLQGQFDLSLTISTAEGDDAKAKELSFMLQTIGNTLGQEIVQLILAEIATLRKMPDLAHAIENFHQEPNELEQKRAELELAKLETEIELMKAEAMERQAKAQVQSAKVGVEQARADNLQSEADNKTLDFVERDSGLSHQRKLDEQSLQHTQKLEGDLTNALLNQELATDEPQDPYQAYHEEGLNQ